MVKNLLTTIFVLFSFVGFAQETKIQIGQMNNGVYQLTESEKNLSKAFEWTFRDGTKVVEMHIEQMQQTYFLVATCAYQGRKRIAAVDLQMEGIYFVINEEAQFKMCSAVACENCRFFLENNKIVACKCEETGTISNHCHYKTGTAATYFNNLQRAKKMFEE
jgi:hypothetical protein